MRSYRFRLYEIPRDIPKPPKGINNILTKELELPVKDRIIKAKNPDEAKRKAKAYVESTNRQIRSLSIGPDGIVCIVFDENIKRHKSIKLSELKRLNDVS